MLAPPLSENWKPCVTVMVPGAAAVTLVPLAP